mgnify:FL=1
MLEHVLSLQLSFAASAGDTWLAFKGTNAVPNKSVGQKHGDETSAAACQLACASNVSCSIYTFNSNSKHCWWRFDNVWDPTPDGSGRTTSGCIVAPASRAVPGCGTAPTPTPPPPPPAPVPPGSLPPFGSPWVRSDTDAVQLSVVDAGATLRWTKPKKPSVLLTYLPPARSGSLAKPGDAFTLRFRWRSDGENKCDPFDWSDGKTCSCGQKLKETCEPGKGTPACARTSVNCIEGTGDFRIALWDTTAAARTSRPADDFCPTSSGDGLHACMDKIGAAYRGYHFRIMPHVSTVYEHPKDSEPGGFFAKQNSSDPFDDHRLPGHWPPGPGSPSGVFPGFAAARGVWTEMALDIAHVNDTAYELTISMGNATYSYLHVWPAAFRKDMPLAIDAFGIWFPNSRSYTYVELSDVVTSKY